MLNTKKKLFDLLKYSQELKKSNKLLSDEDQEKDLILTDFFALIENNFHLREKDYYLELMNLFLTHKMNAKDFSSYFMAKHEEINQILRDMENNFEENFDELSNLLVEHEKDKLGYSFMFIYNDCYAFNLNAEELHIPEAQLRNDVKALFAKLKQL